MRIAYGTINDTIRAHVTAWAETLEGRDALCKVVHSLSRRLRVHTVRFYQTPAGRPVIQEWLRAFDKPDRAILGYDLKRVQFGFPMGLPLCRSLGGGLWEVRSSLNGNREARMIFFHDTEHKALVVVHGFIKKSQKTPRAEIEIAFRRMKERSL